MFASLQVFAVLSLLISSVIASPTYSGPSKDSPAKKEAPKKGPSPKKGYYPPPPPKKAGGPPPKKGSEGPKKGPAYPAPKKGYPPPSPPKKEGGNCDCSISKVQLVLPGNQTQLVAPSTPPKFITIGFGIQNYTCGATGTFGSIGAVAQLFDASCAASAGLKELDALPATAFGLAESNSTGLKFNGKTLAKLGDHTFVTNPSTGSGIVPRFDFTASQNNPDDFVDATKAGDIPAPTTPTQNVDWLMLNNLTGDLASTVFRIQTVGGQPPTSCTAGQATSIPYAAEYWFF